MNGKKLARGTILTALCMAAMLYGNSMSGRAYWVSVKADSTRVRTAANTESDDNVMTTVKKGDQLEVVSEEQGSDGKTWYKVAIGGVSGYVRSDTVERASEERAGGGQAADAPAAPAAQAPAAPAAETPQDSAAEKPQDSTAEKPQNQAAEKPQDSAAEAASSSVVEAIASQAATVKTNNVNVRSSASKNGNVVATLKSGAAVTLTGTTSDASGKKWYQVNFINNGSNVTGFIREDLVEPGEVMEQTPPPAEAPAEGAAPEDAAVPAPAEGGAPNNDFELFFEADADGVDCWYIHDNVAQKRYKLEQLMQAGEMGVRNMAIKDKEIERLKIVLLVLAVLLAVAIAAAAFFGFKYFSARNDDDEEEDEEEEDDDDDIRAASSVKRRERAEQEKREAARRDDRGVRTANRLEAESEGQRRPVNGGAQRKPEGERRGTEAESRRKPPADAARPKNARPSDGERKKGARPSDEARPGNAKLSDEERERGAQPAPQGRRPQQPSGNAAKRSGGRPDVEWKSKNFLVGDEDEIDAPSFINGDEGQ